MRTLLICLAGLVISGCLENLSLPENDYSSYGTVGTVGGGALGAGAGALVGSMISNGDVAKSALTGLGVGAVSGLVLGTGYVATTRYATLEANAQKISENQEQIDMLQAQVDQDREAAWIENAGIKFDPTNRDRRYVGPTIGVYK